eukprot:12921386-Prorocentrum_lima.AAC.1
MEFNTLLAIATEKQWSTGGMDVKTAYLYAPLDPVEDGIILVQPPSLLVKLGVVQPDALWKLRKS